jgi:hypothetical protein
MIAMLAAAALVVVSATAQGQATDPWIGTWKVNLAKSSWPWAGAEDGGNCQNRVGSEGDQNDNRRSGRKGAADTH